MADALTGLGLALVGVGVGLQVGLWAALVTVGAVLLALGGVGAWRERPKPQRPSERAS